MRCIDNRKCKKIIKNNSQSFFCSFKRIENRKKRRAIYAVYAFARLLDELIDKKKDIKTIEIIESKLLNLKNSNVKDDFLWRSLSRVFNTYEMDVEVFLDMIKGQKMDYKKKSYKTFDELLEYCYLIAGTVGLTFAPILSPKNYEELKPLAINLGYAMQITNILRDVGEDYRNARVYIPEELLKKYKYDISIQKPTKEFIELFEDLALRADGYYDQAIKDIGKIDSDARNAVLLSLLYYRAILDVCRESGYDVFTKKNCISPIMKKKIISDIIN